MVEFLLSNGADPTIKDKTGRDAKAIAQHMKKDQIVSILEQWSFFQHFLYKLKRYPSNIIFHFQTTTN